MDRVRRTYGGENGCRANLIVAASFGDDLNEVSPDSRSALGALTAADLVRVEDGRLRIGGNGWARAYDVCSRYIQPRYYVPAFAILAVLGYLADPGKLITIGIAAAIVPFIAGGAEAVLLNCAIKQSHR